LVKLAAVFDVQVGDLFGAARPAGRVVRKGDRVAYQLPGSVFHHERLCSDPRLEVVQTTIAPGGESDAELFKQRAELEFATVLKGKVLFDFGTERHELSTGDSITFPGSVPHRVANVSLRNAAELFWASVPSRH
jgi:quercetin dioxygenase-like cupin family protein